MLFVWFVVWLIANNVGGHEPLILAAALDFGRQHVDGRPSRKPT
jgi:hypothetical protein